MARALGWIGKAGSRGVIARSWVGGVGVGVVDEGAPGPRRRRGLWVGSGDGLGETDLGVTGWM